MEGSLITGVFFRLGQDIPYILCPDKADYDCFEDFSEENGIFEVDPSAICQCTGLRDKNGKLIWENDIVSDECGNMAEIIWNDAELQYLVDYEFEPMALGEWCSVVGNIFDNPELLEVEE